MSPFPAPLPPEVPGRVSVILPAWNSASTVASAVESCLAQSYPDVEVVVVNDGSTDETARVLEGFGDRIRLIHRANGGVASARNTAVGAATGEFVAWMDNDDLMHRDRLRLGVAVLRARADVELVCSDFSAFRSPDADFEASHIATYYGAVRRLGGLPAIFPERFALADGERTVEVRVGDVYELLVEGNFIHPPTVMVRRRALERAGPFDDRLRLGSEYDETIRIARHGRLAYIDRALLRYRRSDTQLSSISSAAGRVELETLVILEKLAREDSALHARRRDHFRRRLATSYVEGAAGLAATDRMRAFGLLARSLPLRPRPARVLRALAKCVLPPSWVAGVKRFLAPPARPVPPRAAPGVSAKSDP